MTYNQADAMNRHIVARDFKETPSIDVEAVSLRLGISKRELAETAGLSANSLQRKERAQAPAVVARIGEMAEIIHRVSEWAGSERQALAWYRAEPLPAFGGRTAESIIKDGKAAALRDYLDHLALGGFA
jgi:transcriptional regulator with XRE-family HTH domain